MMRIERERAFVIQNRLPEISEAEPRIAQIVEQIGAPLPGIDEILVTINRLLETSFAVILVRLGKCRILILRERSPRPRSPARARQRLPKIDSLLVSSS